VPGGDKAWEYYGREDPYFGVLTADQFRRDNLDAAARVAFFAAGEDLVATVLGTVTQQLEPGFRPARALDFGCGVGRLTLPLARRCEHVVGVDVSPSMLDEARANASRAGLTNTEFVLSDDELSRVHGSFDLVVSFIVMQHVATGRGGAITRQLASRLADGGVGVIQFTYANAAPFTRRTLTAAYAQVPGLYRVRNLVKRQPWARPPMQMNCYDLGRVFRILQEAGCHDIHVRFTEANHYGYPVYGAVLHFVKRRLDVGRHS
jgi:2-polyprenyl-3-methyl-5-hydroxy-6-metoxy-1,4-benzoquinol methylase